MFCLKTILAVTLISLSTYDMVTMDASGTRQDVPILPRLPSNYHCLSNADCNTNQCCYKVPKYPIMSKRFLEQFNTPTPTSDSPFGDYYIGSKCYNKVGEGVFCGYSHCGCLGHKSCQMVPISTTSKVLISTTPNYNTPIVPVFSTPVAQVYSTPTVQRARRTALPMFPGYDYRCV
ncbi:Hypothetical predicted protein [Mytilus galloprovincialis]|uniref:Uncharacterized protein n=2 Tax=Mytilus galloprovincialis TaxID=29158 RepID=A0A8B6DSA2_MYTGA|nr:Hypothetical predicted protein [Mytilus galloprovincialis]